jgi:hypothetical protein
MRGKCLPAHLHPTIENESRRITTDQMAYEKIKEYGERFAIDPERTRDEYDYQRNECWQSMGVAFQTAFAVVYNEDHDT